MSKFSANHWFLYLLCMSFSDLSSSVLISGCTCTASSNVYIQPVTLSVQHLTTGGHKVGLRTRWPAVYLRASYTGHILATIKQLKLYPAVFGALIMDSQYTKHSFIHNRDTINDYKLDILFLLHSSLIITVIYGNIFPRSSAIILRQGDLHHCLFQIQTKVCPILHSEGCIKINNHISSTDFHSRWDARLPSSFILTGWVPTLELSV